MVAVVDFLPFAVGGGANVEAQSSWAAETSLLANGFTAGVASSQKFNKALRQSSIVSAVLAQFIAQQTGADVLDDGTTATILANLAKVFQGNTPNISAADGSADALTGAFTPAITALTNGMALIVRAGSANATTTPTFKADGTAAKTIVKGNGIALVAGDIAGAGHWIELQYDLALDKWVLLNPATGVAAATAFASNAESQAFSLTNKAISPATLAAALQGSNQSLAASGYQKLPGGLILQWGFGTLSNGTLAVTFPVTFPNACRSVTPQYNGLTTQGAYSVVGAGSLSTTGFTAWSNTGVALMFDWISIGY